MGHTRYTLLTLVKDLAALEELETVDDGLTLTELARRLKESQTVAFRVLKTIAPEEGYTHRDTHLQLEQVLRVLPPLTPVGTGSI